MDTDLGLRPREHDLAPFQPPLWLRLLLVGLSIGLAFVAVLAAGVALAPPSSDALAPLMPALRWLGLAPLVVLAAGVGGYLLWLVRREARLRRSLGQALALSEEGPAELAVAALQHLAAAARVHHPHLAARALLRLAELAEDAGDTGRAARLLRQAEDFHLDEGLRRAAGWPALSSLPEA